MSGSKGKAWNTIANSAAASPCHCHNLPRENWLAWWCPPAPPSVLASDATFLGYYLQVERIGDSGDPAD